MFTPYEIPRAILKTYAGLQGLKIIAAKHTLADELT